MEENCDLHWPENVLYWDKISEKTAELVLKQTELVLIQTIETAKSIQDKADKLTALLIPSISATTIYVLSGLDKLMDIFHITAMLFVIVLIVSQGIIFFNLRAYSIRIPGSHPETLINNHFINREDTEKEQYIQLALQLCKENKLRTEKNNKLNARRSGRNQSALKILALGLILSPVIGFILHYIFSHHSLPAPCR